MCIMTLREKWARQFNSTLLLYGPTLHLDFKRTLLFVWHVKMSEAKMTKTFQGQKGFFISKVFNFKKF